MALIDARQLTESCTSGKNVPLGLTRVRQFLTTNIYLLLVRLHAVGLPIPGAILTSGSIVFGGTTHFLSNSAGSDGGENAARVPCSGGEGGCFVCRID